MTDQLARLDLETAITRAVATYQRATRGLPTRTRRDTAAARLAAKVTEAAEMYATRHDSAHQAETARLRRVIRGLISGQPAAGIPLLARPERRPE